MQTIRVRLDQRNLLTFGVLLTCTCGQRHWVTDKGSYVPDVWPCKVCGRPLVAIGYDGQMYLVGDRVSERRVEDDEA
jgi:hypothetical protein